MGWLWSGRGKPRSRPRVARAIVEARDAHARGAVNLGGATALMEQAIWTHQLPASGAPSGAPSGSPPSAREVSRDGTPPYVNADLWLGGATTPRRQEFGAVGQLLERAEDTARKLGRSRAEMWEEALRAWLDAQSTGALTGARVSDRMDGASGDTFGDTFGDGATSLEAERTPRPWLFEARRQRVWGEIDETLGALRTA